MVVRLRQLETVAEAVKRMREAHDERAQAAACDDYERFGAADDRYAKAWDDALAALDSHTAV